MNNDTFNKMLADGLEKIDRILTEQGGAYKQGDVVALPFHCWGCERMRYDFELINGDGIPMCQECFNFIASGLTV